jgi:8-oxo-dGTP diphosphatase
MPTYKYPRPSLTVDAVVFGLDGKILKVLLIKRGGSPFKGRWALPGGFVHMNESLDVAVKRELREETGIKPSHLEQLCTFGDPKRDPRGRVVSAAYFVLVNALDHSARARSDASAAEWFPLERICQNQVLLAFDHRDIIAMAHERLKSKARYTPIGFNLLGEKFTFGELQSLYETILGKTLDKRNFRKKILEMGAIEKTEETLETRPPSVLYRFNMNSYKGNFEI